LIHRPPSEIGFSVSEKLVVYSLPVVGAVIVTAAVAAGVPLVILAGKEYGSGVKSSDIVLETATSDGRRSATKMSCDRQPHPPPSRG
jgi:hypothetical protein